MSGNKCVDIKCVYKAKTKKVCSHDTDRNITVIFCSWMHSQELFLDMKKCLF